MEEWRPITEFLGYSISDHGRVLNTKSGRIMSLGENQKSIVIVGLMHKGVQRKRAVSSLVAKHFLEAPRLDTFDAVINKDGDRQNNFAVNLDWRPLWFTRKYHEQFERRRRLDDFSIADMDSGREYVSIWDAVTEHGLLASDILQAIYHNTHVWPTRQRFWRL